MHGHLFACLRLKCFGWSISSEYPSIPKPLLSQVMDAQEHVYRLMSSELNRLSSNLKKTTAGAADRVLVCDAQLISDKAQLNFTLHAGINSSSS